jgi:hypothetical protein
MKRAYGFALLFLLISGLSATAQWLSHPTSGIPRTPDGRPDLSAPAPVAANGKPDLSGLWMPDPAAGGTKGIGETVRSPYFLDITAGMKPEDVPFKPWAEAEYRRRLARDSVDDPAAHCQPMGLPGLDTYPLPFKILQNLALVLILYEHNSDFRQIFLDGRDHPRDPQPTWMGYSTGKWEADRLVVETVGFNDRSWLDRRGHPHSESLGVIERFRRLDVGRMEVEITIDDPQTYTRPIVFTQLLRLLPDSELLEYVCSDNEKFFNAVR